MVSERGFVRKNDEKRVLLTTQISSILAICAAPYIVVFWRLGLKLQSKVDVCIVTTLVSAILLNKIGFHQISKLIVILCVDLGLLFYATSLGKQSGIHLVFFALISIPLVIFNPKEKKSISFGFLLPICSMFYLEYSNYTLFSRVYIEDVYLYVISNTMIFVTFFIISLSIYFYYQANEKATIELEQKNAVLESQKQKIEADKKELEAKLKQDKLMRAGEQTQKQMLQTEFPQSDAYSISVLYTPSDSISGDFYWTIELLDGRVASLVFDVTGHGVPAAIIMTAVAKITEDIHKQPEHFPLHDPATMLSLLNQVMFETRCIQKAVACVYTVYDPVLRQVSYAYAGGEVLVVVRDHTVIRLEGDHGFPLRMMEEVEYVVQTVQLEIGDHLLAYSDGLYEFVLKSGDLMVSTFSNEEDRLTYDYSQFQDLLKHRPKDKRFTHYLAERFEALCNENKDDVTVLVLEVM